MEQDRRRRVIRLRNANWGNLKCPECDTKMQWVKSATWKCPNCGLFVRRIPSFGKYPEMKHDEHGARVRAKYYRIEPTVRYLKPTRRKTKVKGKEYIHYVISTTVPDEWKDGVKVAIEPLPTGSSVKELRRDDRDMNEMGPRVRRDVKEHFDELEREADRIEQKYQRWKKQ